MKFGEWMKIPVLLLAALAVTPGAWAEFERPSADDRLRALGDIDQAPAAFRLLLTPDSDFAPIAQPGRGDWLSQHEEKGQTFEEFRTANRPQPDAIRHVIYLQPLGKFPADRSPPLEALRTYTAAFFQMEVKVLPALTPAESQFEPRKNPRSGQRQILAGSVIEFLAARMPADGFCLLGVTMDDLYPEPSWNYVFGQASMSTGTGVYSFARYDPAFWGEARGRDYRDVILRRSCKVLTHEIGHMFGLGHCIYFQCMLNGGNNLAEADASPQHACPVCLRKLYYGVAFDPVKRYRDLAKFYLSHRWSDELSWTNRQLAKVK